QASNSRGSSSPTQSFTRVKESDSATGWNDTIDFVITPNRASADAGQDENLAIVILGEGQNVGQPFHTLHFGFFHRPAAVGAPGREENLAIHLVERLGPVAENVFS